MVQRVRKVREGFVVLASRAATPNTTAEEKAHAELIGKLAMEWNTAHFTVYQLFETLTGTRSAWDIFWAVKADSAQRDITLAAASFLLKNQKPILDDIKKVLNKLGSLAGERNAIIHTAWGLGFENIVGPPADWTGAKLVPLKRHGSLKSDFKSQVNELGPRIAECATTIIAIDHEIQRRLALSDKDPRQLGLPKPSPSAGDPPSPAKGSEPPPQSSQGSRQE